MQQSAAKLFIFALWPLAAVLFISLVVFFFIVMWMAIPLAIFYKSDEGEWKIRRPWSRI